MDITVAVVAYNAEWCIKSCLESLLRQKSHGGRFEILVVDGCSTDGTRDIIRGFGNRVRLVENPKRTISSNRNVAIREARYPIIAFTDSDCVVPDHWLNALSDGYKQIQQINPLLAGVGGGNAPPPSLGAFQAALGISLNSFIGSLGSVQGKLYDRPRAVESLSCLNVLYDLPALKQVGGFDEELKNMCEDTDINHRLIKRGRTLYFIPGADIEHHTRQNLLSWCSNMYAYGVGRARIMCKHRTVFSPSYLLALLFLPGLLVGSLVGSIWPWALLVWLYIPLTLGAGFVLALKKNPLLGLYSGLILMGTHFFYTVGLWRGLAVGYPSPHPSIRK